MWYYLCLRDIGANHTSIRCFDYFLGDVFQIPVGDLFEGAFWPGLSLVGVYVLYIAILAYFKKDVAPAIPSEEITESRSNRLFPLKAIIPPLVLIILVLGSIFEGIATPTESSAIGCVGAVILAYMYKSFSLKMIFDAAMETE